LNLEEELFIMASDRVGRRWKMKTALKAALLSAFVFPGMGQMYLKRHVRGLIQMILVLAGLGILIAKATLRALQVLDKIQVQGGAMDMNAVSNLAATSSATSSDPYSQVILFAIIGCWVFSVIDAYRLGKANSLRSAPDQVGEERWRDLRRER
jgi:hypothetical protein